MIAPDQEHKREILMRVDTVDEALVMLRGPEAMLDDAVVLSVARVT